MNLLITGCAGFIGARTSQLALDNGHSVVGLDNLNDYYDVRLKDYRLKPLLGCDGFQFHQIDIEDVDACIMTVDKVKVFGIVQVSMGIEQAKSAQQALNSKYFIPTGIAPSRTKGLISYILSIKEFFSETDLLPTVCRDVGDTLSI